QNSSKIKEYKPTFDDDDIWTILFTSGTTGSPKGVVLTYGNMRHVIKVETTQHVIGLKHILGNAHFISVLPLNHIGERMAVEMACLITGGTISFVESINSFVQNIQDTQPTLMFTVPHLWSKFQLGVLEKMPQKRLDMLFKIPIISGIVKNKIKQKLGLSRMVHPITASAPIPPDLKQWYMNLGLDLREVYGMTETTGLTILTPPGNKKTGSVGLPIDGLELKIDEETKEILLKGPSILKGYYKNPEKSAEVIQGGWLHTGDRGRLDEDGYLFIDGRLQDTFKTSKGKYVVPSPIEWKFGTNENIEQIVVAGLGLAQPLALIRLSEIGKAKSKQEIEENLLPELKRVNEELINFQRLSHIVIINDEWTIENKILTPTLKVKRNLVQEKYQDKFNQWASKAEKIIWT
ncbi:MAG: AMP-binding protein, partial [Flavobacteriaceae bacterium]|nr:AMP-binding protein [Candidatus Onthonaster equi]